MKKFFIVFAVGVSCLLCWATQSQANTNQLKIYRNVYPDLKPNCQYCHIDKIPKKESHDFNAYGAKLKELMGEGELTEEIISSVGRHDEFVKEEEELKE